MRARQATDAQTVAEKQDVALTQVECKYGVLDGCCAAGADLSCACGWLAVGCSGGYQRCRECRHRYAEDVVSQLCPRRRCELSG